MDAMEFKFDELVRVGFDIKGKALVQMIPLTDQVLQILFIDRVSGEVAKTISVPVLPGATITIFPK